MPATSFVLFALVFALRWKFFDLSLERDEGEYALMGQQILKGIPPYLDAYNMKFPGTYLLYALGMAMFGQTPSGIHLWLAIVNAAATCCMFVLARRLAGPVAGWVAATSYIVMSLGTSVLGLAAHATQFQMAAVLAGLVVLERGKGRDGWALAGGLFMGLAVLIKQPGAAFMLPALALVWWDARRIRPLVALCLGAALPILASFAWLWHAGVFSSFWYWTITYARYYGGLNEGFGFYATAFYYTALRMAVNLTLLMVTGVAGVLLAFRGETPARSRVLLATLMLAGLAGFSAGGYFRNHYAMCLLPAWCLALGLGAIAIKSRDLRFMLAAAWGLGVIQPVWMQRMLYSMTPAQVMQGIYSVDNPFNEARELGTYLHDHTRPEDRVFVFGSEPEICFYADRRPATGYMYLYPFGEHQPLWKTMEEDMEHQVDAAKPRWVVTAESPYGLYENDHMVPLRQWYIKLQQDYKIVGYEPIELGHVSPFITVPPASPPTRADVLVLMERLPGH